MDNFMTTALKDQAKKEIADEFKAKVLISYKVLLGEQERCLKALAEAKAKLEEFENMDKAALEARI